MNNGNSLAVTIQPPIRLLMVTYTLCRGGAEQSIVNIIPSLLKRGVQIEVASLDPPYELANELESLGVKVHKFKLSHRWNLIHGMALVIKLCRKNQYDIIQCYDFYASNIVALTKNYLKKSIIIVSFQGLEFDRDVINTLWLRLRRVLRLSLLKSGFKCGVAVSVAVQKHYAKRLGGLEIVTIENPFPPRIFEWAGAEDRASLLSRFNFRSDDFVIIMVARFIPEKAHVDLVEAIRRLALKGVKPKVLCFGIGPLKKNVLSQISGAQLTEQIFLLDPLPHHELFPLLGAADLYVQPSTSEGFSLAIGEAMALARPVLSTKVGGTPELIEDGVSGVLIEPNRVDQLVEKMLVLIRDDELRQRLGLAAQKIVLARYHAENLSKKWVELYNRLIKSFGQSSLS